MNDLMEVLAPWMRAQRWYTGKGTAAAGAGGMRLVAHAELPAAGTVRPLIVLVADDAAGRPVLYQVPLALRTDPADAGDGGFVGLAQVGSDRMLVYDGTSDPVVAPALVAFVLGGGQRDAAGDGLAVRAHSRRSGLEVVSARVLSGEQSNTSIIAELAAGPPVICKIFRMLAEGVNPDVELQGALTDAGSAHVAPAVADLVGDWPAGDRPATDSPATGGPGSRVTGHLAFAQEFLPGVEDAWRVALTAARTGTDFTARARDLGAATAQVHQTLAHALGTVPAGDREVAATVDVMHARLEEAAADVPELAPHRPALAAVFERAREASWPALQRIHGDLHLGQVLDAPGRGWVLLDFEGEPLRPLAQRTQPDVPARDVAGMLRSLDYAAASVRLEHGLDASPWARAARQAFLDGYRAAHHGDDDPRLLAAFEADKAVYEAMYEARNRPTWIGIPLSALERLATGPEPA